jgi:Escherichia/Staphylococcus phage prohead protease
MSKVLVPAGQRETRQVVLDTCEIRADGDKRTFVGHAAVFDSLSVDLGGFKERIQRGAFRKVLSNGPDVRFLKNHDPNYIYGRTTAGTLRLREDGTGLLAEDDLPDTESAREFAIAVERRDITGMSFSFRVRPDGEDVWTEEDGELIRTIISFGQLYDVGGVVFPAYPATDAAVRAIAGVEVFDERGEPLEAPLLELAWKVYRGEVPVSEEQRGKIDAALEKLETVSPWRAQHVLRAVSQEPELQGVLQGKRVRFEDAQDVGEPHWRLAARRRRESILNHDLKV